MSQYSPSQEKQLPPHPPPAWNRWTDGWLPEIVAAIFGFLCFIGLIIMLLQCDGKANFDWHGVTVNALVALLSTLSRACLMVALAGAISQVKWILFAKGPRRLYDFETFDLASRDAWGRLQLLWRSPVGPASIGALGAILALAFDPFAQQLVSTAVAVQYTQQSLVSIGRADRYSAGSAVFIEAVHYPLTCNASALEGPVVLTADFDIQAAVWNAVGSKSTLNRTIQQLQPDCPSGNCTWSPFESLAVCSRCNDVAATLAQSHSDNLQMQMLAQTNGAMTRQNGSVRFTLPNGVYLETQDNWRWDGSSANLTSISSALIATYGTSNASETLSFKELDTLFWSMSILRARPRSNTGLDSTQAYVPEAKECALYYCVNSYRTQVVNGILSEEQKEETKYKRDPSSWQMAFGPTTLRGKTQPRLTPNQVADLGGGTCIADPLRTDLRLGSDWNISYPAVASISDFINSTFATAIRLDTTSASPNPNERVVIGRLNGIGTLDARTQTTSWQPPAMQPLFESDSIEATFAKLARGMSNSIRSNADNNTVATGSGGELEILVKVRWPWLALPATVLVVAILQLVISIISTRRSGAPIWKSSSLASLSRGNFVPESIKAASSTSAMEKIARDHEVELFERDIHPSRSQSSQAPYSATSGRSKDRLMVSQWQRDGNPYSGLGDAAPTDRPRGFWGRLGLRS